MAKELMMSAAGLKTLQDELDYLKIVRRKELAEEIKEARSHGDLSENAEYDEAKNAQGLVENRINELEQMLKNVKVIDESALSSEVVSVGTRVRVQEADEDAEEYDIVGRTEADPINGKISDESPVGAALVGKKVGSHVDVTLPSGAVVTYEVLEISPSH
ncbi:MAG: transcription elongation factor GreA [Faecalibacterium sp.]